MADVSMIVVWFILENGGQNPVFCFIECKSYLQHIHEMQTKLLAQRVSIFLQHEMFTIYIPDRSVIFDGHLYFLTCAHININVNILKSAHKKLDVFSKVERLKVEGFKESNFPPVFSKCLTKK